MWIYILNNVFPDQSVAKYISKNIVEVKKMNYSGMKKLQKELTEVSEKRDKLRELDLYVLDNSLRETTVGQLRGHTLKDKWDLYNQVWYPLATAGSIMCEHDYIKNRSKDWFTRSWKIILKAKSHV